jgi:hypothetical protein
VYAVLAFAVAGACVPVAVDTLRLAVLEVPDVAQVVASSGGAVFAVCSGVAAVIRAVSELKRANTDRPRAEHEPTGPEPTLNEPGAAAEPGVPRQSGQGAAETDGATDGSGAQSDSGRSSA